MAVEEEVSHVQIVCQHLILGEVVVHLMVEVAGMDLILLLLCQPLGILFLVEGVLCVVIHLTLLMSAPIVEYDASSIIQLICIE